MNTEYLHSFLILSELKNFSKARDELYISQPALTKQIKKLEDEIGYELFSRNTRGLELTDSGKIFMKYAKLICELQDNMHTEIDSVMMNSFTTLRIGYITNTHKPYIQKALEKTYRKYPNLDVTIVQDMPPQITQMIRNGLLDCAVMHLPSVLDEKDIEYKTVIKGGVVARISDKNPLASRDEITLADISNMEILVSDKSCPKCNRYTNDAFALAGIKPNWHIVNNIESVEFLTRVRNNLSFTSEYNEISTGLATVKIKELSEGFDIVFAYNTNNRNPHVKQLYNNIMNDL